MQEYFSPLHWQRLQGTNVSGVTFHLGLIASNLVKTVPLLMKIIASVFKPFEKKDREIRTFLSLQDNVENGVFSDDKNKIILLNEKYGSLFGSKLRAVSAESTRKYFE